MTKFIVTPKGAFEEFKDGLFEGYIKADFPFPYRAEVDRVEATEKEVEEGLEIVFNQMPLATFQETLAFLKWCHLEKHGEGIVLHKYLDGKWENHVPFQWNSGTSICYHTELDLKGASRVAADTHSHPPKQGKYGSGSYHSSTDGLDERKQNGLFTVVTGFTPFDCDADIVGVIRGKKFHLRFEQLFDCSVYNPKPSFPEEWKGRVGGLPCDGCRKLREENDRAKSAAERKSAFDEELAHRLLPKAVVDLWKKETENGKNAPGAKIVETYQKWIVGSPVLSHLVRCDNYGCYKLVDMPQCPHCKKGITGRKIAESVAQAMDEVLAKEDLGDKLEEYKKRAEAEIAGESPDPSGTAESEAAKSMEEQYAIIASDKPCGTDCPYTPFHHIHCASKALLEQSFRELVVPKCQSPSGLCFYTDGPECDLGCSWSEYAAGNTGSKTGIPKCDSATCAENEHGGANCEIRRHINSIGCPSARCMNDGHVWHSCEVWQGKVSTAVKKDGETRRIAAPATCDVPDCRANGHVLLNCPERIALNGAKGDPDIILLKKENDDDGAYAGYGGFL